MNQSQPAFNISLPQKSSCNVVKIFGSQTEVVCTDPIDLSQDILFLSQNFILKGGYIKISKFKDNYILMSFYDKTSKEIKKITIKAAKKIKFRHHGICKTAKKRLWLKPFIKFLCILTPTKLWRQKLRKYYK